MSISGVFHHNIDKHAQEKYGLHKETDAYLMISSTTTVQRDDKITYQSVEYRVINVREHGPAGDAIIYKYCELHRVTANDN